MTVPKSRRLSSPRLGTHGPRDKSTGSVHARLVSCVDCDWHSNRVSADDPCRKCGGAMVVGTRAQARASMRVRPQSCGVVGMRDPLEEQRTEDALRANREAAGA